MLPGLRASVVALAAVVALEGSAAFVPTPLASCRHTGKSIVTMHDRKSGVENDRGAQCGVTNRRDVARLLAGAASVLLIPRGAKADDFGAPVFVLPGSSNEKRIPPPRNPYEQLEPFGESFRGNKGPNLQVFCHCFLLCVYEICFKWVCKCVGAEGREGGHAFLRW